MFSTIVKGVVVAAAIYGAYVCIGSTFSDSHKAAFGLLGMGVPWLVVGAAVVGFAGIKMMK